MINVFEFIKETFKTQEFIPLHEPRFIGNEKKYYGLSDNEINKICEVIDEFI
ncbi:hypothetical protein [Aliarcobacter cryaerophilus]|uniref:hypothetical protein n=1 Tax=Aliarcobacter cryaerophilus TaxID=28198 RepID=UPI003DA24F6C